MAIAFRDANNAGNSTGTNLTITKPAGTVDGDILVVVLYREGNSWSMPDANWTVVRDEAYTSAPNIWCTVAWKRASSEGADYTFNIASTFRCGVLAAFSGCLAAGDVIDASTGGNFGSGAPVASSVTTSSNGNMEVVGISNYDGNVITYSSGTSLTLPADGHLGCVDLWYAVKATAGDTGTTTFGPSAGPWATVTIALKISGAIVNTETGATLSALTAQGADVATFTEAGLPIASLTVGGASVYVPAAGGTTYTKTGAAISAAAGSGTHANIYTDTGRASSAATATGASWYPIVFVGSATASGGSGDVNVTPPATILNDLLICAVTSRDNVESTFPAGWNVIQAGNNGANLRATVAWKRATGAESAFTITHTAGDTICAGLAVYRNTLAVGTPIDTSSISPNASSDTCTATSITTRSLYPLVVFTMHDQDNGASSAQTCATTPAVMRERFDVTETTGGDAAVSLADMWIGAIAATGNATGALTFGPDVNTGILISLKHALSETTSGTAISGATGSGASEYIPYAGAVVYTETGSATSALTARGADVTTTTDTGLVVSAATIRGSDAVIFTETGAATSAATISGTATKTTPATIYTETGSIVSTLSARGTKATTYTETGRAAAGATMTGTNTLAGRTSDHAISVGDGYTDVTPREIVRTAGDVLYVSAWKFDTWPHGGIGSSPYNSQTLRMYKANQTGLPSTFTRVDEANEPAGVTAWGMALDGNGLIHVIWSVRTAWDATTLGVADIVRYCTFDTATDTWGSVTDIETAAGTDECGQNDELVSIAIDADNVPHIMYLKSDGTRRRVTYRNKIGGAWSAAATIDDQSFSGNQKCWHPGIAFDRVGRIIATWMRGSEDAATDGRYFVRIYSGGTWSATVDVTGVDLWVGIDTGTPIYVDDAGRYHTCFLSTSKQGRYYFSDDQGATWTANNFGSGTYLGDDPTPGPGPNGTVRVYCHSNDATPNIVYFQGDGGAATWGAETDYTTETPTDCSVNVRWSQYHWYHFLTHDVAYWHNHYPTNQLFVGVDIYGDAYVEAGRGIVGATVGGVSVHVRFGVDIFEETGAVVVGATATGADVATFAEAGAGLSSLTAGGADATTFTDSGYGLVTATIGGALEFIPRSVTIYTETGAVAGALSIYASDTVTFTDAGATIGSVTISGADVATFTDSGLALLTATASGADAAIFSDAGLGLAGATISGTTALGVTYVETGGAIADLSARGSDVSTFTDAGYGLLDVSISGADASTFSDAGYGLVSATASGADSVTYIDAGYGVIGITASGASEFIPKGATIYTETGAIAGGLTAYGSDSVTYTDAGLGLISATSSGADSVTFTDTGYAVVGATGSGASEYIPKGVVIYSETGAIVGELSGRGYDATTFSDAGLGLLDGVPLGTDTVTMTRSGYGLVGVTATGTGEAYNTAFALHVGVGRVRLLNAPHEVDKLTEYGIDLITSIKEVDDGRAL